MNQKFCHGNNMITIKNVSFSYNAKPILSNLTFAIKRGEHVAILGKSGCGKTTLVNILAGYLPLSTGSISIDGKSLSKPGRNRIVVSQENDLFDWLTVWQNMSIVSQDPVKIEYYLSLVDLISAKDIYPTRLSGGMKKRLSLARALLVEPSFLILDEPFASLDHKSRDAIQVELSNVQQKTHKTILHITHNIDEAIYLSDRVILLGGSPASILREFSIDFTHPRRVAIKSSNKFEQYRNEIMSSYI